MNSGIVLVHTESSTLLMEKAPKELSASALRKLLIVEVQKFISSLDYGSTEELQQKKDRLKEILHSLTEKERHEMARILWGKNTSRKTGDIPSDDQKISSDEQKKAG